MGFLQAIALWLFSTAAAYLARPRIKTPTVSAAGLGDIQVPTSSEGRPIPVFFGRRLLKATNLLWYGDLQTTPIVDNGSTTGHKYSLGFHLGIAMGPVDELLEIRFEDRATLKPLTIGAGANAIVFGVGSPSTTALVPLGNYDGYTAACDAAQAAMRSALPGDWQVVYGYEVRSGRNDEIEISIKKSSEFFYRTVKATLVPGVYTTGAAFMAHVVERLNLAVKSISPFFGTPLAVFSGSFSSGLFHLTADDWDGVSNVRILATVPNYDKCALARMGYQLGTTYLLTEGVPLVSNYPTGPLRVSFVSPLTNGKLGLADAGFTAAVFYGFNTGSTRDIKSAMGDLDREFVGFSIYDVGDYWQVTINEPGLFGGDTKDGGVVGTFDIYKGTENQLPNDYLQTALHRDRPGYRWHVHVVARRPYIGNTPYLKSMSFLFGATRNGLGMTDGKHSIGGDANPACILYELLTNNLWGCGRDPAEIDLAQIRAAGEQLYDEGLGLSMDWDRVQPANEFKREIEKHIDGAVVTDRSTGLLILKLARNDYDVDALPVLDPSNCRILSFSRPAPFETLNAARGTYIDRDAEYVERTVQAHDMANLQTNAPHGEDYDFRGFSRGGPAQLATERVLSQTAFAVGSFTIEANRVAWAFSRLDPFVLNWPALQIAGMVCRVAGDIDLEETGPIVFEALQDVRALAGQYDPPGTRPGEGPAEGCRELVVGANNRIQWGSSHWLTWFESPNMIANWFDPATPANGARIILGAQNISGADCSIRHSDGGVVVVWVSGTALVYQHVTAAGAQWNGGTPVTIQDVSSPASSIDVIEDGAGGYFITWSNQVSTTDVFIARVSGSGALLWGPVTIGSAANAQQNPVACLDGAGGCIVVWRDARTSSSIGDLYAQRVTSAGGTLWASNGVLIADASSTANDFGLIDIASDGLGGAFVVASGGGFSGKVVALRINSAGSLVWGQVNALPTMTTELANHRCFTSEDGNLILSGGGGSTVHIQKLARLDGAKLWGANGTDCEFTQAGTPTFSGSRRRTNLVTDGAGGAWVSGGQFTGTDVLRAVRVPSSGLPGGVRSFGGTAFAGLGPVPLIQPYGESGILAGYVFNIGAPFDWRFTIIAGDGTITYPAGQTAVPAGANVGRPCFDLFGGLFSFEVPAGTYDISDVCGTLETGMRANGRGTERCGWGTTLRLDQTRFDFEEWQPFFAIWVRRTIAVAAGERSLAALMAAVEAQIDAAATQYAYTLTLDGPTRKVTITSTGQFRLVDMSDAGGSGWAVLGFPGADGYDTGVSGFTLTGRRRNWRRTWLMQQLTGHDQLFLANANSIGPDVGYNASTRAASFWDPAAGDGLAENAADSCGVAEP